MAMVTRLIPNPSGVLPLSKAWDHSSRWQWLLLFLSLTLMSFVSYVSSFQQVTVSSSFVHHESQLLLHENFIADEDYYIQNENHMSDDPSTPIWTQDDYLGRFSSIGRLYDESSPSRDTEQSNPSLSRIASATVAIFGLGGVGSWTAEALVRSGIMNLILVDLDDICISNINRQVHATSSTVGKFKIDVMKQRLLDISPSCSVTCIYDFVTPDNALQMIDQMCPQLTLCVDAIDGHIEKSSLIAACCVRGIPIVSCGGSAGRSDPTRIRVDDLSRVSDCRLLFQCKKRLRDYYRLFAKGPANHEKGDKIWKSRKWNIRTVYSTEVIDTNTNSHHDETIDLNNVNTGVTCNIVSMKNDSFLQETSSLRMCDNGNLGTACFVTGAFGLFAASEVVSMIAKNELKRPRILKTHWLAPTDMVQM